MTGVRDPAIRPPWPGDDGARLLFSAVRDACEGGDDLPTRLEAGLRVALGMLADDPELAYGLTVAPYMEADDAALDGLGAWLGRFGGLLRSAAAADPRASHESSFVAQFLIGGVRFQIGRLVLNGEAPDLLRILPGTLEALLAYYFEPGEPRRLAYIALAGRD